jgi:hypothetical protein
MKRSESQTKPLTGACERRECRICVMEIIPQTPANVCDIARPAQTVHMAMYIKHVT